jgi:UDP-2-acetamido-3-amino-2,3-dideoxy-glucuronate N-acetyltransferase
MGGQIDSNLSRIEMLNKFEIKAEANEEACIAVVGCGKWGRNLVRNFAELGALRVICDVDPLKLQHYTKQHPGVLCVTDFSHVLADERVKGVVLATPATTHYELAKACLDADKDVLVEKPLALRVEEGEELVHLATKRKRLLMVGHVLNYHPAILKLKQLIHEGILGKLYYIYSNRLNLGQLRHEENILWSFAPHDISVLLYLLEEMPVNVSAHGGNYLQPQIADVTITSIQFPSGVQAHIFVSWLHPYKEQKLVVIGDKKMAVFDDLKSDSKLTLYDYAVNWVGRVPSSSSNGQHAVEVESTEPLRSECEHFLECIQNRQTPRTDGQNGLAVLRVLEACQRSLRHTGKVEHVQGHHYNLVQR